MSGIPAAVSNYYDRWIDGSGDMTQVPLSKDFTFDGPVGRFADRESFQQMASQFAPVARNFRVRERYVAADSDSSTSKRVCSIVEWELPPSGATTTAAEIVTLDAEGSIEKVELLYDPLLVNEFVSTASQ